MNFSKAVGVSVFTGFLAMAGGASAMPVTYQLNAQFDDGVTASGSYAFDAASSVFSDISVTASSGEVFSFVNPFSPGNAVFLYFSTDGVVNNGVTRGFSAQLDGLMTNLGGTFDIVPFPQGSSFIGTLVNGGLSAVNPFSDLTSGSVTSEMSAVPLPAAGWMLLGGLGLLGWMKRRAAQV